MRRTSVVRFLTLLVVASFTLAGPLAPLAHAQQPAPAAEQAQPTGPETALAQPTPGTAPALPTPDTTLAQPTAPETALPQPALPETAQAQPALQMPQAQPAPQSAQAQPTVQPPPAQPMPPAPSTQPAQPDLFQETLKAQRASDRSQGLYTTQAAVVNVFRVPGHAITCAAGVVVGIGVLMLSLGSGYKAASGAFNEGCGGKWIVRGDDMRPDTPPSLISTDPGR